MQIGNLVATFFEAAGPGGVVIMAVLILALITYYLLARWILAGGKEKS